MRGQPIAGDINHALALRDPTRHHPPADSPLQTAQSTKPQQSRRPTRWDLATREKPKEPDGPDKANNAPQLAMPPFPPVNGLKVGQGHPLVLNAKFINGLIFREFTVPISG